MVRAIAMGMLLLGGALLAGSCHRSAAPVCPPGKAAPHRFYARAVGDTFFLSVALPPSYRDGRRFPVVYLLDANLYFDILAVTLRQYSAVGLIPEVILVGVGYRDLGVMDSLRSRDDTYPEALPEYDMHPSGGADRFLRFLHDELVPAIDRQYRTDTGHRVLMGHSLGAYFVAYALVHQLAGGSGPFSQFIAASPSLHYNRYYLTGQLRTAAASGAITRPVSAYFTSGGLEEEEDSDEPGLRPAETFRAWSALLGKYSGQVRFKADIYSGLGHMDMAIPTFIKGLNLPDSSGTDTP